MFQARRTPSPESRDGSWGGVGRILFTILVLLAPWTSLTFLSAGSPEQIIKVVWSEQGKAVNGSWSARYEHRFRLSSIWNGRIGGGANIGGKMVLFGAGTSSPEGLYKLRGSLLGLKPGEMLQYYLSEADDSGTEVSGNPPEPKPMKASLSKDGLFSLSAEGTTYVQGDAAYRKKGGIPTNENFPGVGRAYTSCIDVKRTQDGLEVILWAGASGVPYADGGPGFPSSDCSMEDGLWEMVYQDLSTFKVSNEELKNWRQFHKSRQSSHSKGDDQYSASVALSIEDEEDEAEVSLEAESSYEKWLPEGNLAQPGEPGNDLQVRLQVHKKGDPSAPRRAKLSLALPYVSKNSGVCMNWPAESAAGKEGLRFRQEDFAGDGPLKFVDALHVESKEEVESADVMVHAYDYGAWGTLRVTARDLKGKEIKVKVRGKDTPDLSIPLDEDGNRIADAWEAAEGVKGLSAASDDDDEPPGKPGTQGDGLSLYEEYRGFSVQGQHLRTHPKKKDVFICDLSGLAGPGIDLFANKTLLAVHKVTQDEMGATSRIVNRNYAADTHAVDQHGILIKRAPPGTGDPEAIGAPPGSDPGPPANTEYIALPEVDYVHDSLTVKGAQGAMAASMAVVAHELCHAVGVFHHGDADQFAVKWEWRSGIVGPPRLLEIPVNPTGSAPTGPGVEIHAIRETDGYELQPSDPLPSEGGGPAGLIHVFWKNGPSKQGTEGSGVGTCIMCYTLGKAVCSSKRPGVRYLIPAQERVADPFALVLCDSARGTGTNDPGHSPEAHHGDASPGRGNCKAQIVVSDRYAKK